MLTSENILLSIN